MPLRSIYPLGWKVPVRSIYPLEWKCPSGLFTLQVPSTLRDGNALRIHLRFGMEVHVEFICPSGFIYPSGWKCPSDPFTLRVGKYPSGPFTLRDDYDTTSAMLSTHIHCRVGKYLSSYLILTMDYTKSHTVYVFPTYASLYGKNLHIKSKDPFTYSYPPSMGRRALRSRNVNSISFI